MKNSWFKRNILAAHSKASNYDEQHETNLNDNSNKEPLSDKLKIEELIVGMQKFIQSQESK